MATFPALRPAVRGFTAANYPGAVHAAYSGKEGRVRTSNAQTGARLRLQFAGLAESDMLSIASHYAGQRGRFIPFQLSTEVLSGMADPGAVTPAGYQWIYVSSPKITDISVGTPAAPSCVHDVELELELVPEVSALVGGANWIAQAAMAGGAADDGEIRLPGAAWVATAAIGGGEAIYDGSASGAEWTATASIAGGEALGGASAPGATWASTAAIAGGQSLSELWTANGGATMTQDSTTYALLTATLISGGGNARAVVNGFSVPSANYDGLTVTFSANISGQADAIGFGVLDFDTTTKSYVGGPAGYAGIMPSTTSPHAVFLNFFGDSTPATQGIYIKSQGETVTTWSAGSNFIAETVTGTNTWAIEYTGTDRTNMTVKVYKNSSLKITATGITLPASGRYIFGGGSGYYGASASISSISITP